MRDQQRRASSVIAIMGVALLALTACSGDTGPSVDGEDTVREVELESDVGTSSYADGVFTSSLVSIRITDSRVIPLGEEGNEYGDGPVLALWYETTNVAGQATDPLTAWLTHFRASQDTGEGSTELTLSVGPDADLASTQTSEIAAGATAVNAISYHLLSEDAPVLLSVSDSRLNEIGSQSFPLR